VARFEHEIRRRGVQAQHVAPALAAARKRGPIGRQDAGGARRSIRNLILSNLVHPDKVEVFVIE
jgi:hypothetical protein